jgi:integrase
MKESRGRSWKVSPRLRKELKRYIDELGKRGIPHQPKRPLFPTDSAVAALDSRSAWESWRRAADVAGLEGRIGTHSGRKTFAWRVYDEAARQMREGKSELDPMRAVQLALGHKSIETTISYMGFLDKDLDKVINALFSRGEL